MSGKAWKWLLVNTGVVLLFLWGVHFNNSGILYLSLGIIWVTIVTGIFGFADGFAESIVKSTPDYQPSVPVTVDTTYDVIVMVMLAYFGFGVTALFYFFHIIGLQNLRKNIVKLQSAREEKPQEEPKEEKPEFTPPPQSKEVKKEDSTFVEIKD